MEFDEQVGVRMRILATASLLLILVLLPGASCEQEPKLIKVLGTGKAEGMPILTMWFTTEPSTDPTIIPTRAWGQVTPGDIKRYMRIYFPRTYEELSQYEFFFLAQVDMSFLTPKQQQWIYDALTTQQKGGVNTRSIMSVHPWFHEPWRDSIISKAFPNDVAAVIADAQNLEGRPGPLIIRDDPGLPPIMSPYKKMIEPLFQNYGGLNTVPKQGSVILSYTKNNAGIGYPIPGQIAHVFYWHWNRSITFTFRDMVYDRFWSQPGNPNANPYALDIVVNVVWFSTGRKLPEDAMKIHELRKLFYDYRIEKSILAGLLDFAEKFGANPSKQYVRLSQIDDQRDSASDLYLTQQFDPSYSAMKEAIDRLKRLEASAVKLKNRALMWVYTIEWTVTTGVLLVAGFILWTLMVRRALYREVSVTRAV